MQGNPRSTEIKKKMPCFGTHTLAITKITHMKIFHLYPSENFSDLFTEKWPQIGLKGGHFSTKILIVFFFVPIDCKNIHCFAFSDSVDTFRHKICENRLINDCFMVIETLKTCKMDNLLS